MSSIDLNTQPKVIIPHKISPMATIKTQDDLGSVAHKNDGISGASAQVGSQPSENIRVQAQKNLEALKSSKNILGVGHTNDVVTLSVSAVTGATPNQQDNEEKQFNQDAQDQAKSQSASQSARDVHAKAKKNLEALKSSKNILGVEHTNDVETLSVSTVTGTTPNEQEDQVTQEVQSQAKDSADIESKAKEYLAQYNNKTDEQKQQNDDDNAINGLKRVFGEDVSEEKLNQYRDQMKSYFGVDLFARGSNSKANGNNASNDNNSFANFTDNKGNLRDINGYMDTLGRVKTDNPSVRITTAAELQNYARDHYDDDLNYVKEGDAENTFGEERHQMAKNVNSKSEDYSFKDHLSQVGREIYKARYSRTDTDQSQGVQELKADNTLGTAKSAFLNTITQNMASDTASFTQYDYADIQTASQDLNDDITSSDTTYAVSGAGRS